MDFTQFISSERFTKIVVGVGLLLAVLLVFEAGVYVGTRKAEVSFRMGDAYYRAIGPDNAGAARGIIEDSFSDADGAAGKVVSVNLPTFLIADPNRGEKLIMVSGATAIRKLRDATSSSAITPNDYAVVIGEPDENGEIQATFIRLLPPPPKN